jgi:hypothetical protein
MTPLDMSHSANEFVPRHRRIASPQPIPAGNQIRFVAVLNAARNAMGDKSSLSRKDYNLPRADFRNAGSFHGD